MKNLSVLVKDENGNNIAPNFNNTSAEYFSTCIHIVIELLNGRISREYGMLRIEKESESVDPTNQAITTNFVRRYTPIKNFLVDLFSYPEINENFIEWNNASVLAQLKRVMNLDGVTSEEEEVFLKLLQSIHIPGVAQVTIQPFPLLNIAAHVTLQYKAIFFKQLPHLPQDIIDKFPELDTNYINKFKLAMNKQIKKAEQNSTCYLQSEESQNLDEVRLGKIRKEYTQVNEFFAALKKALESDKSYNNIHHELSNINKQRFEYPYGVIIDFKKIAIEIMKKYNIEKEEYGTQMGQKLS